MDFSGMKATITYTFIKDSCYKNSEEPKSMYAINPGTDQFLTALAFDDLLYSKHRVATSVNLTL